MASNKEIIAQFGIDTAREIADEIFADSQENLIEDGSVDTSNLLLSGGIKEDPNHITIFYDAPYANDIDEGTKPHFVEPKQLEGWVKRKINPGSEKKVKSITFAISKAIEQRGTIPTNFMTKAVEQARAKFNF